MDLITDLSPLSPGLIDELEAFMAPVGEGCYSTQPIDARRLGGHQLPESPPDSGSENPYSPSENQVSHAITVSQTVLGSDYMLVDHLPTHEMLQQNGGLQNGGEYIYEELKSDNMDHELRDNLNDVVVLPQDAHIVDLGLRSVRHELALDSMAYQNRYSQIRVEMSDLEHQGIMNPQLVALSHEPMTPVYANLQEPSSKKRKHSQEVNSQVKCEPAAQSPESVPARGAPSLDGSEAGDDAPLQCIRFQPFQQTGWHTLYDANLKPLPTPSYVVGADKGFNYSQIDEAFVCQKKNHFQVTCQLQLQGEPHYVKAADGFKKINSFCLHFYGVKAEDPSQEVRVEQSQSDRTKKPFHPVPMEIRREGSKVTVGRLHFAETTNNNMRKKGRPNPDQRHFQLVVALRAHGAHGDCMVAAQASERIIVRASNPGQFESDCAESWWQRGVADNSVHFSGRVGINTDRPDEACVINGNLKVMGHIVQPSDARAKHDVQELDTAQQLRNVQSIRVVKFNYDPMFAEHSGLLGLDPSCAAPRADTGVIAQEVRRVLPEAVKEAGDVTLPNGDTIHKFLVVNKDRIFMENLGAVKELCKVTGHLESRISQLERINKRLCGMGLQRRDSCRSSGSNDSRYSAISNSSKSFYSDGNISLEHIRDIARNIRKHECCQKLSHNSPKYTRKLCKNCQGNTKYGKYYNANKTAKLDKGDKLDKVGPQFVEGGRGQHLDKGHGHQSNQTEKSDKTPYPSFEDAFEAPMQSMDNFSSISKNKDVQNHTNVWVHDAFGYQSSGLAFCCRKKNAFDSSGELISNKFLQIVITILIFIMAVCLVVMSALYFREHQELLSMKEGRLRDKINYPHYGKFVGHNAPEFNQIQNLKPSQHTTVKKSAKEKAPHKTSPEITTPTPQTTMHASKNYVSNVLNLEPTAAPLPPLRVSLTRVAAVVGAGCYGVNTDNELDNDCQDLETVARWIKTIVSSCGPDPPQTYENQEPLERNPEKDLNDTFVRPIEPMPKEKIINIPMIIEKRNNTYQDLKDNLQETLTFKEPDNLNLNLKDLKDQDSENLKENFQDLKETLNIKELKKEDTYKINDEIIAESNLLDSAKQNGTEIINGRLKRQVRKRRETNEALLRSSSEEMTLTDQSDETGDIECDTLSVGVSSGTTTNGSLFVERGVCAQTVHNYTYTVPLSRCVQAKHIDIIFRSSKLKELRLCDLHCKYETAKDCLVNRESAKPVPSRGGWRSSVPLDCSLDRTLRLRGAFGSLKDLCYLTPEDKLPFVEYNIRIYRDCHN